VSTAERCDEIIRLIDAVLAETATARLAEPMAPATRRASR
jgi:hypothetical protein